MQVLGAMKRAREVLRTLGSIHDVAQLIQDLPGPIRIHTPIHRPIDQRLSLHISIAGTLATNDTPGETERKPKHRQNTSTTSLRSGDSLKSLVWY